jgi:hypothetical protein
MNVSDEPRRSFLISVAALAVSRLLPAAAAEARQDQTSKATVLGADGRRTTRSLS